MRYLVWFDNKSFWRFETVDELLDFNVKHGFPTGAKIYKLEPVDLRLLSKNGRCPSCSDGVEGVDPYCDECWKEYLGTHCGGR